MSDVKATLDFESTVVAIEEKYIKRWLGGVGPEARFKDEPRGWFVGLKGSYEYLHAGKDKPNIEIGDIANVRITFHAQP